MAKTAVPMQDVQVLSPVKELDPDAATECSHAAKIPQAETKRSLMLQQILKIPHAIAETQHSQIHT